MRDMLSGGVLVTRETICRPCRKPLPRRRADRNRPGLQAAPVPTPIPVQPGQLASPLLVFGFPSLALH